MASLTSAELSAYRKKIHKLLGELQNLATRCLYLDPLIAGTPNETYRRCGKKTCPCRTDINRRHGPYWGIKVVKNGKQKQYSLRRDEKQTWKKVVHYKYQMDKRIEFNKKAKEISDLIAEVIDKRTEEYEPDE